MPLINLSKEELKKIEFYLLKETDPKGRFTDPIVVSILEKIGNLDDICECGGQNNLDIEYSTNEVVTMSDEEIQTFITTFKSFMQHADVEEMNYLRRESTRKYKQLYYQNQAKKHNVSYDYYLSEFT